MEFRVLGTLEAHGTEGLIRLGGAKQRGLLAIFLTRPNRVVSADQLVEDLWEGRAPDTAATALRVHLTRLRGLIEPDRPRSSPSTRLPASSPGYRLVVGPDELDAQRFERKVTVARQLAADGSPAEAADALDEALGLWRGTPFSGADDLLCVQGEVARLDGLRAGALEDLAEARLSLGEHAALVGWLEVAVAEQPLREQLTGQLMLALYRSGRQAEALRAYSGLRVRLGEELGIEPTAALAALEQAILLQRPDLDWQPPAEAALPPPPPHPAHAAPLVARSDTGLAAFVGRADELGHLEDVLGAVAGSNRRLVLVGGPPGIGKTSLAQALGRRAASRGVRVLSGRCDAEPIAAYQPFAEAIRTHVRDLTDDELLASDSLMEELVHLVPELASRLGRRAARGAESDSDRYRLFEAVAGLLRRSASRPVLLVLDDLQWADTPTLLLVRHLALHPELSRLMILGTYRDTDVGPGHPLAETLVRVNAEGSGDRVTLTGMDTGDVRALLEADAPTEVLGELLPLAATVHEVTDGNPFFVKQMIRHLADHGGVVDAETLRGLAPDGIRDLVSQRLAQVSSSTSAALRTAAVIGRDFSLDVLARSTDLGEEAMLAAVEEALGAQLVEEHAGAVDRYGFVHALFRNAVYGELTSSRRIRLHRRVGEAIEELAGDQPEGRWRVLAHHFALAAPTSVAAKAVRYLRAAADEALESLAYEDAVDCYRRALGFAGEVGLDDEALGDTLLALGRSLEGAGSLSQARETLVQAADVARRRGDAGRLAEVALAYTGPFVNTGEVNDTSLALLDEALEAVGGAGRGYRAQLLDRKAGALYYLDDPSEEEALAGEALALGRQHPDPPALVAGLTARHRFLTHRPEDAEARLGLVRETMTITEAAELHGPRLNAQRDLLTDLLGTGAVAEFDHWLDEYEREAREFRRPAHLWWAKALRVTQTTLRGGLDEGERLAAEAHELGKRLGQDQASGCYVAQLFVLSYQQGRLPELGPRTGSVIDRTASYPSAYLSMGHAHAAVVCAETGLLEEARGVLDRLGRQGFDTIHRDVFWHSCIVLLAAAAARCGASEHVTALAGILEPYAGRIVVHGVGASVYGSTHGWLGALLAADRRWDEAERHLAAAIDANEAIGAPYWAGQARLDLAGVLLGRGRGTDRERSAGLVADALVYARRAGAGRLLSLGERLSSEAGH